MSDTTATTANAASASSNPLLDFSDLPRFGEIRTCDARARRAARTEKAAVDRAASPDTPATWNDIVETVERETEKLCRARGIVGI